MAYRRSRLMEERLADNRERIVRAARHLVARGGFREAQIAAVATEAGLSTGSIYRYFPSKAELFVELLGKAAEHEIDILRSIAEGEGTPSARLFAAVESFTRRALDGRYLAYAFIAEPVDPEVDEARIRHRRAIAEVLKSIVRAGIESGEFPDQDLDASAACLVGAFTEALIGPTAPSAEAVSDRERLIEQICTFCFRAIAGRDKASS